MAGPVEATAIGNLLVQLTATGNAVDLRKIREVVANSFDLARYQPSDTAAWNARLANASRQ